MLVLFIACNNVIEKMDKKLTRGHGSVFTLHLTNADMCLGALYSRENIPSLASKTLLLEIF